MPRLGLVRVADDDGHLLVRGDRRQIARELVVGSESEAGGQEKEEN